MISICCVLVFLALQGGLPSSAQGENEEQVLKSLDSSFSRMARLRNEQALTFYKEKNYPAALSAFQDALELDPEDPEILNNLGYLYHVLGNREEAARCYAQTLEKDPERYIAYVNYADLLIGARGEEDLALAARLLVKARELKGNQASLILRQARVAAARGLYEEARGFYNSYVSVKLPTDEKRLEIGDFHRDFGKEEEALEWYRQISDKGETGRAGAQRIWRLEVEKEARRYGWTPSQMTVPSRARVLTTRGRIFMDRDKLYEAERMLREAVGIAPTFAEAHAALGDVLKKLGQNNDAEMEYLRAVALEHSNAEYHVRLGELYLAQERSSRAREACFHLQHALELQPGWTSLRLSLARALQASGDVKTALQQIERYLAETRDPPEEARALQRLLRESLPKNGAPRVSFEGEDESGSVHKALARSRALLSGGEADAAMAELRRLDQDLRTGEVLTMEARILLGVGRLKEARELLLLALESADDQAEVQELLGLVLEGLGQEEEARTCFLKALELGEPEASYHLARQGLGLSSPWGVLGDLLGYGRLLELRNFAAAYLEQQPEGVFSREAGLLLQRAGDRMSRALWLVAGVITLLLGLGAGILIRRRSGADLRTLIQAHPETGPEVQRILAAIRHELLKHNTMVLAGLEQALRDGEEAGDKAAGLYQSLFGQARQASVSARLEGYLTQLRQLAAGRGLRLNLERRDRAMAPLIRGFQVLEKAGPLLQNYELTTRKQRQSLGRLLARASSLLNQEGYSQVQTLLHELRLLEVEPGLIQGIFDGVIREASLAREVPPELELMFYLGSAGISVPRQAFSDVMSNLIRNALLSSLRHDPEFPGIGVQVDGEVDPITGEEWVVFLVQDRSSEVLTNEMIRSRLVEGGLGLAADLVARFEGTIRVRPCPGWAKAVEVRFPRAYDKGAEE